MQSWFDLRMLATATSYVLSPAYYCSGLFWTALGYSTSLAPDRLLRSITHSTATPALAAEGAEEEEEDGGETSVFLSVEEEREVAKALKEVLLGEEGEENEEEDGVDSAATDAMSNEAKQNHESFSSSSVDDNQLRSHLPSPPLTPRLDPSALPLPPSPSSPSSHSSFSPSPPPTSPSLRHSTLQRNPRPLSASISRLSRRSTLCLSRLSLFVRSEDISLLPSPNTSEPSVEALELEQKLVERLMGEEIRAVRGEVEVAVEEALGWEAEREVEEEKDEDVEEKEEAAERVKVAREASAWSEINAPASPTLEQEEKVDRKTWFGSEEGQAFQRVSITSEGVDTEGFLRAVESWIRLGELIAPAAASLCISDLLADVARIRARLVSHPSTSRTLETLLSSQRRERRKPASDSIIWLLRLLGFAATMFRYNLESLEKEELSVSATRAWEGDFSKHFPWIVRPLFKVFLRACPSRASVYSKLAAGAPLEQLEREMKEWVGAVERVVQGVEGWKGREGVVK